MEMERCSCTCLIYGVADEANEGGATTVGSSDVVGQQLGHPYFKYCI